MHWNNYVNEWKGACNCATYHCLWVGLELTCHCLETELGQTGVWHELSLETRTGQTGAGLEGSLHLNVQCFLYFLQVSLALDHQ